MTQQNTVIEYPTGLSSIPYASFLQIDKYEYSEAQKKVATNQNDALGSVNRSKLGEIVQGGVNAVATTYGSGDTSTEKGKINIYQTQYKVAGTSVRKSGKNNKTVDITTANDNTRIVVNGKKTTVGELKRKKQELIDRQSKGLMSQRCMLPLPNEFQYKYGAEWNNEFKLGTLALAADEAYRFGTITAAGGLIGGGLAFGADKLTQGSGVA